MIEFAILAAGVSLRFGRNKLTLEFDGETLLERAIRACGENPIAVVCSPDLAAALASKGLTTIVNDRPERGMAYSLRLANARVAPQMRLAVLPADLALIEPEHVAGLVALSEGFDVTFPRRANGTPGHPVIFSPAARERMAELPDGDTIRRLRDCAQLSRNVIRVEQPWPYLDVDRESDLPHVAAERQRARCEPR